jgi:hypothetical protein
MSATVQDGQAQKLLAVEAMQPQGEIPAVVVTEEIVFLKTEGLEKPRQSLDLAVVIAAQVDPSLRPPPADPIRCDDPVGPGQRLDDTAPGQMALRISVEQDDHLALAPVQIGHIDTVRGAHLPMVASVPFHVRH